MASMRTRAGDAELDAIVVGTGPNGLAAALVLARAGLEVAVYEAAPTIGGGTRTAELTLPGFLHDVCSAVHPMALASPFFRAFDLAGHGVRMLQPEIAYAHPLDGGRAGLAWRDLEATAEGLGRDGDAWRSLMRPLVRRWEDVTTLAMSDLRRAPPLKAMTVFGTRLLEQSSPLWGARFREDVAPALLSGVSAHAIAPPSAPTAAGVGLLLATLAHAVGWPVPEGGSRSISAAMAAEVRRLGGRFITGRHINELAELPRARTVILNVSPRGLLRLAGDDLPRLYARWLRGFRYGGGVCKVDFALSGSVPWSAPGCERTGTLHLVGSRQEAQAVEHEVRAGRHAERPYVLAVQAGVADPGRAPAGHQALSAYAHVPQGSSVDVSEAVITQIERFAPGFRDLILGTHVVTAQDHEEINPNYVGGDIAAGAMTVRQTLARPAPRWDPYATPIAGVYLCSASTPPGPGVHGMAGLHAARRVLRREFGIKKDPLDLMRDDSTASEYGAASSPKV